MELVQILGIPLLVCLEMIAILGYLGIHVLKREVIFIDIALAQIAAVGAIGAELAFEAHGHSVLGYACAFGATLVAAAFFSLVRRRVVQIPLEAVIGVSYAIAAAGALFLVGIAPGGHVHVQQMLAGSILWATWADVMWAALLFGLVGSCFYVFRRPFASISEDYEGTAREGVNTLGWDLLFYALLGVVVTLAVRIAGVVVVFAFLDHPRHPLRPARLGLERALDRRMGHGRSCQRPRAPVCRAARLLGRSRHCALSGRRARARRAAQTVACQQKPQRHAVPEHRPGRTPVVPVHVRFAGLEQSVLLHPSPEGAAADAQCCGRRAAVPAVGVQGIEEPLGLGSHAHLLGRTAGGVWHPIGSAHR